MRGEGIQSQLFTAGFWPDYVAKSCGIQYPTLSSSAALMRSNERERKILWQGLPPGSNWFFVECDQSVCLQKLLKFWNNFRDEKWDPVTSWMLAYEYLNIRLQRVANNLLMNGVFLEYANSSHSSLGAAIDALAGKRSIGPGLSETYPWLLECRELLGKPYEMSNFLVERIPTWLAIPHWQKNETSVKSFSSESKAIWDDEKEQSTSADCPENNKINVLFLDAANKDVSRVRIAESAQLKHLFNHYVVGRKAALRSLRFSYKGKTLFPSAVGGKTPGDLGMEDWCTIMVGNATDGYESDIPTDANASPPSSPSSHRKKSNQTSSTKRCKGKQKRMTRPQAHRPVTAKTMEASKIEHSIALGKLHEEAGPRFKIIRQRLNDLLILRSKPKDRSTRPPKLASIPRASAIDDSARAGVGGKAGKSRFAVQVGEVANLHKSSKRRGRNSRRRLCVDLHGMTREEALETLESSLPRWNDIAMSGSYPFVVAIEIICGCGRQALSEAVEHWIKCHDQVAIAPKMK